MAGCMKIKALLMDFDGVVVDSTQAYMKATNTAMKCFNHFQVPKDEVREISLEIARRLDQGFARDKILDGVITITSGKTVPFLDVWLQIWDVDHRPLTRLCY